MGLNPLCMSPSRDLPTTPHSWQVFLYLVFHITTSKMRQVGVTNLLVKWPHIFFSRKAGNALHVKPIFSKNRSIKMHQVPKKIYNTSLWQPGCTFDGILRPLRANMRMLFTCRLQGSVLLQSVPCSRVQIFFLK